MTDSSIPDPLTAHFDEHHADIMRRARLIQRTLLDGYEATAAQAREAMVDGDPMLCAFQAGRLEWAEARAAEVRAVLEANDD